MVLIASLNAAGGLEERRPPRADRCFANAIVTPRTFAREREVIVETNALVIEGVVQNQRGVVAIKADRFTPIGGRPAAIDVSHDFH